MLPVKVFLSNRSDIGIQQRYEAPGDFEHRLSKAIPSTVDQNWMSSSQVADAKKINNFRKKHDRYIVFTK